jgi:trehalose-6-phosphatase
VQSRLRGTGIFNVIGKQAQSSKSQYVTKVRRWLPLVKAQLEPLKGVTIDAGAYSIALSYRLSREKKRAKGAILKGAAALKDVRVIEGKQVVTLLPNGAPHKGITIERALTKFRCDTALYVGNDEEVFSLDQPGRLLTIRVGLSRTSAATYYVESQEKVDDLLRALHGFRSKWQ